MMFEPGLDEVKKGVPHIFIFIYIIWLDVAKGVVVAVNAKNYGI